MQQSVGASLEVVDRTNQRKNRDYRKPKVNGVIPRYSTKTDEIFEAGLPRCLTASLSFQLRGLRYKASNMSR